MFGSEPTTSNSRMAKIEAVSPEEVIILMTGDRKWDDIETMYTVFRTFPANTVLVHGYAVGADTVAKIVCEELGLRSIACPAHWRHNEPKCIEVWGLCPPDCNEVVGRPAGVIRNKWMFDTYRPTVVHGFHNDIQSSRGTKDMLKYARKMKCDYWLHTSTEQWLHAPALTKPKVTDTIHPVDAARKFFNF
jgi:hypothetical protein